MFKKIKKIINRRFNLFYRQRRLRLVLDVILIALILALTLAILSFHFYRPTVDISTWFKPHKPVIDLNNPPLELDYEIATKSIIIEDSVNIKFNIKNNSLLEINNLQLNFILQIESFLIDKLEIVSENLANNNNQERFEIRGASIYLKKLEAHESREVSLKIYLRQKNVSARIVSWRLDSEYLVSGQTFKKSLLLDELIIAARPQVSATVYYHSPQGDQLGAGPIPPLVGLPTNFWIFYKTAVNSVFSDFILSARLAKNVELVDNSSLLAGNLQYFPDSRQIVWTVNQLKDNLNNYRAAFEVQLIPTANQLNTYPIILENIRFQAQDEVSGLTVNGFLNPLDTSLKDDLINRGEGRVSSFEEFIDGSE